MGCPQAAQEVHGAARVRATTEQTAPHSLEDADRRVQRPHELVTVACAPWGMHAALHARCSVSLHDVPASRDVCAGSWNEINADQQRTFSVLGYTIDTIVTWEDDGRTLVSTMTTTAAGGHVKPLSLALFHPSARPRPTLPNGLDTFGARVHHALGKRAWATPSPNLDAAVPTLRRAKVADSWLFTTRPKATSYRDGLPPRA